MEAKLPFHEWSAVVAIAALILLLATISYFSSPLSLSEVKQQSLLSHDEFEVFVAGAVEDPKSYMVKKGTHLQEVLALAKPLSNANLKELNLEKKLKSGETVTVPVIEHITIYLKGAVRTEETLTVLKGTILDDLLNIVEFHENADPAKLRKKRKLKDQEVVHVPFKKAKRQKNEGRRQ